MADADVLDRFERWYLSQCNGDWEHSEGVKIGTLDNPGWRVRISLADTELQSQRFDRIEIERSDDNWIHAWVEDDAWHAAAGPLNLAEALRAFLAWADA